MPSQLKPERLWSWLPLEPLPLSPPKGEFLHPSKRKRARDARKLRSRVRRSIKMSEEFASQRRTLVQAQQELLAALTNENKKPIEGQGTHEDHKQ
jgi:hypothetical protein